MTGGDERGSALVTGAEVPDRPRVVDEAHEVLTTYAWQLAAAAGLSVVAWIVSGFLAVAIPPLWLLTVLAVLAVLYLVPVSREPRLARDVLRRCRVMLQVSLEHPNNGIACRSSTAGSRRS